MPATPPPGWEATVAPGAAPVVIEAISPNAILPGELALIGVCLAGFTVLAFLLVFLLLKRSV